MISQGLAPAPFGHSPICLVLPSADEFQEYPYDTKDFPERKKQMIFAECNDDKAVKSLSSVFSGNRMAPGPDRSGHKIRNINGHLAGRNRTRGEIRCPCGD